MRDINDPVGGGGQNSRAKFKQRLAGGAVLVIVLAIFFPFIFNHAHQNTTLPVDNNSTSSEQPQPVVNNSAAPAQTFDQAAPPEAAAPVEATAPVQPSASPPATDSSLRSDQPGLTPVQSESSGAEQPQQMAAPAVEPPPPAAAANAPAVEPVTPLTPPSAEPAAAVKVKPARAAAVAARVLPPPVKTVKDIPQGRWMVQVGSFSQAESAQRLASKLRASGLPAYTREVNLMTRVYIGPFASQQQAEKIQQKVADQFHLTGLLREVRH